VYSKHRLEALSDGIFAIAMTLLVLELKVPQAAHGQLWPALKAEAHAWVSFIISFAIAARFWTLQHSVFDVVDTLHHQALVSTFFFLGLISVLPFTTSLWGHNLAEPLAFLLYFLNQLLIAVTLIIKLEFSARHKCLKPGVEIGPLRFRLWNMGAVMATAVSCAYLVPLRYLGFPPAVIGFISRRVRHRLEHKMRANQ
jgi:uncharacterized membrane protein